MTVEPDDREHRLRSRFGFMMLWTTLTIGGLGYMVGILLDVVCASAGAFLGFRLSDSGEAALQMTGHVLVGIVVLAALVQSYLVPVRLTGSHPEIK